MNTTNPRVSIIIRARNEERWIGETLQRLQNQTFQDFEIVIVDSGSTDETLTIAEKFPVRIVHIAPEEFTYPYAINFGIKHAHATDYYAILSAHSLPIDEHWLAAAVESLDAHPDAMGVYGPLKAMPNSTITDKIIHDTAYFLGKLRAKNDYRKVAEPHMGILAFTNALIRKDLWQQHPIDEAYAGGGEDQKWAEYWLERGKYAIKHMGFAVHHSHYLGPIGWIKQLKHWKNNATPQKFTHLKYRHDGAHKPLEK